MSFVAGRMLTAFEEDEAFYVFYHMLHAQKLRLMYLPGLQDLQRKLYVFTQLANKYIPTLWAHLLSEGVDCMMYATEWFMTLFCRYVCMFICL